MTVAEFEELLDGMNEYSEEMQKELDKGSSSGNTYEGEDAIKKLQELCR